MTDCKICNRAHNHLSCPYCGAIELNSKHYDMLTMREIVRAKSVRINRNLNLAPSTKTVNRVFARLVKH